MTRIFFTRDKDLADATARHWLVDQPDVRGVSVASTSAVSVVRADNPFHDEWRTEGNGPWYLVLATEDKIAFDISKDAGVSLF